MYGVYRILVSTYNLLGRLQNASEDNTEADYREIGCEDVI
jgi:hypothetical protein